ncbi:MAG: Abi family protein, partial [Bacteroidaceae bacterium]|nr:Abi family protein [Bacteroidaceae bacterium]
QRTLQLYHHNLKLSQRLFGVIGMFEIALRNAIHNHYSQQFNDKDWIVNSTAPGMLLAYDAKELSDAQNEYKKKGIYSADKMVATFNFGFWTYLFTKKIIG